MPHLGQNLLSLAS
jgi:hypothetical protein